MRTVGIYATIGLPTISRVLASMLYMASSLLSEDSLLNRSRFFASSFCGHCGLRTSNRHASRQDRENSRNQALGSFLRCGLCRVLLELTITASFQPFSSLASALRCTLDHWKHGPLMHFIAGIPTIRWNSCSLRENKQRPRA